MILVETNTVFCISIGLDRYITPIPESKDRVLISYLEYISNGSISISFTYMRRYRHLYCLVTLWKGHMLLCSIACIVDTEAYHRPNKVVLNVVR